MKDTTLYPLKFRPVLKQVLWGGERILPFKHLDEDLPHVGESWEVSDVPGSVSVVSNGIMSGRSLTELIGEFKERLVGENVYRKMGGRFPLLVKFIDAKKDLSVQVHPDDELARKRNATNGKTEMWYILDAAPGAFLLSGFNKLIKKEELQQYTSDGSICGIIQKHPVKRGDCFFIPAGQVHAIGAHIFLIEIQQTSDVTYRIYDYNRKDKDGKPRQLHIKEAEDAIDFEPGNNDKINYGLVDDRRNEIVRCPYFTTSAYRVTEPYVMHLEDVDSFVILIAYDGGFTIETGDGESMEIRAGETVLLPAETVSATITPQTTACGFLGVHID